MGRRASVEPRSTVFDKYRPRTYLREKLLAVFIGVFPVFFCTIALSTPGDHSKCEDIFLFLRGSLGLAEWCIHSRFPLSQPYQLRSTTNSNKKIRMYSSVRT